MRRLAAHNIAAILDAGHEVPRFGLSSFQPVRGCRGSIAWATWVPQPIDLPLEVVHAFNMLAFCTGFILITTLLKLYTARLAGSVASVAAAMTQVEQTNPELEQRVRERTTDLVTKETMFRVMAETLPVGIFMLTPDGVYEYVNPDCRALRQFRTAPT